MARLPPEIVVAEMRSVPCSTLVILTRLLLVMGVAVACSESPPPIPSASLAEGAALPATRAPAATDQERARRESCQARISQLVRSEPALEGTPKLDAVRGQVLGRAKATPVLFVSEPRWEAQDLPLVEQLRQALVLQPTARELGKLYHLFYRRPDLARAVLLRQGYLYTDEPGLAFALLQKVELDDLFDVERVVIQRGSERLLAARRGGHYVYETGSASGERAKVLLFDRVWAEGDEPGPALHVDLESLAGSLGFWRARAEYLGKDWLVLNLLYGDQWVLTLLKREGPELRLECELLEPDRKQTVLEARRLERRRRAAFAPQQAVIDRMVEEALPFDEPRTEDGQQDGKLRPAWRTAYRLGQSSYEFNGDKYYVFDARGRPKVPQVCIDFITDTLERASGSWWLPRGQQRARANGKLSFRELDIDNQRSVERFTDFAWRHPEQFDVYYLPSEEQIPLRAGDAFFAHLQQHAARYRPGDVVTILGLRDDEKYHYHSFFVYKSDPVTGMPIWLAGNAGRPRLRSWYGVLLSAPKRSVQSRIRPRLEWLEAILGTGRALANEPESAGESSG